MQALIGILILSIIVLIELQIALTLCLVQVVIRWDYRVEGSTLPSLVEGVNLGLGT